MRLPVTARIALLSIVLALASNLAVILFIWQHTRAAAIDAVRRDTIEEADTLAAAYRAGGLAALTGAIADTNGPDDDPTLAVAILGPDGRRIAGVGPARVTVPLNATRFGIARLAAEPGWADEDAGYALRRVGGHWLLDGHLLTEIEDQQQALEQALAVAVLVSLVLGIVGGIIVSRYVARRLVRIAGVIEAVGEGDLSRRVGYTAGGRDAFDRLAARLDATLDKVERLMGELRVVTDGLAHDLRSPLARLRAKTEQAVLLPDGAAREAALGGLLAETDLVMRMLTTLIEISRSEQVSRERFVWLAPADLVEEIGELYAPVIEDAGLAFTVSIEARPPPMPLHRELVSQAITNLIDNALKHAAAGGEVVLRLSERADAVLIAVSDRGPGIAEADRTHALSRFGRLDAARSTPGAGLGMALVEAVARLHDGRVELADNGPGLTVQIVLPGV